jgi:hypothetical protein
MGLRHSPRLYKCMAEDLSINAAYMHVSRVEIECCVDDLLPLMPSSNVVNNAIANEAPEWLLI